MGFTLIRRYDPLDIKHIPYPSDLWCAVVHPRLEIKTMESRKLIPKEVPMSTALQQCGNLAGLVAGLATSDYGLISRSVNDVFAEPYRTQQLPDFKNSGRPPCKPDPWAPVFLVRDHRYSVCAGGKRWLLPSGK